MTEPRATFGEDEFTWSIQLAERLRLGQWDEADRADLIAHLETFVVACRSDVSDASILLLQHLLLATTLPVPSAIRRLPAAIQQRRLRNMLRRRPGLHAEARSLFVASYAAARNNAAIAAGWPEAEFPAQCPWTLDEALAVKWTRS